VRFVALRTSLVFVVLAACERSSDVVPDLILVNGRVFTADSTRPWAEALAIRGDRIVGVGSSIAIDSLAGDTRRVDLEGRVVIPGFNDAHDHLGPGLAGAGASVIASADPLPDPPFSLVLDSLRAAVRRTAAPEWLTISVGNAVIEDPGANRSTLNRIAPEHPVALLAWTGHGVVLNATAFRAMQIPDTVHDPIGGFYERDANGRPTGKLFEYADWQRRARIIEALPESVFISALRAQASEAARYGITSVQNVVLLSPGPALRMFERAAMPLRHRVIPAPLPNEDGQRSRAWGEAPSVTIPRTSIDGVKFVLDGTPIERLAVIRTPYADRPGHYGRLNFPPDTLRSLLDEMVHNGVQPHLHIVGDSTAALVLALMETVAPDSVWRRLRPRFEHGDGLAADLQPRARRLGVIVVQNPTHFAFPSILQQRLGAHRARGFQPLRSLIAAGIPVALGSDGPRNPFLNVMLATLHPNNPAEAISREQAVVAYTRGSAYAERTEHEKGVLAKGMLADLAVLSQDIFTIPPPQLPATISLLTLVGGTIVHDAGVLRAVPARP